MLQVGACRLFAFVLQAPKSVDIGHRQPTQAIWCWLAGAAKSVDRCRNAAACHRTAPLKPYTVGLQALASLLIHVVKQLPATDNRTQAICCWLQALPSLLIDVAKQLPTTDNRTQAVCC